MFAFRYFSILALAIYVFAASCSAAGRVQIEADQKSGPAGAPLPVKIKLLQGDASDSQPSTGEKAEIKIRDAQSGQECKADMAPSDSQGYVSGSCTATEPGDMTIYATSKDRGDSSEEIRLSFTEQKDPEPSGAKKQMTQTGQLPGQQAGQAGGSSLANQPGLAEDQNGGRGPLMDGLQTHTDDAEVAGASDAQPAAPATAPTSDIDLLNSLIYLTGGIILLIAGIYFIYVQSKQASQKKKKEKELPQPSDTITPSKS